MGNDILNYKSQDQPYVAYKKLPFSRSTQHIAISNIEKVFGKIDNQPLRKNQTAPCLHVRSIVDEEITQKENSSPPMRQTRILTNQDNNVQPQVLLTLQQQIKRLKLQINQQMYTSRNNSPIKPQKQNLQYYNNINKTSTRQLKHYFKLKGCQPSQQAQDNQTQQNI